MKNTIIILLLIAGTIIGGYIFVTTAKKKGVADAKAKSFKDIDDAVEATKNIVCAQSTATAKSPYDNKIYAVSNPCVRDWLGANRDWETRYLTE